MNWVVFALGVVLIAVVVLDLLWTTLWADGGAGPLSGRVSNVVWKSLRRLGGRRSRLVSLAGPLTLIVTLAMWVTLLWAGWTLLFGASDSSLSRTGDSADRISWPAVVYFVGYTLFTMGNGDFSPVGGFWQVTTGLTTASGMLLVTLAVSYVLSVLGAVAQKRSFAGSVRGLGATGEEIVRSGWNGRDLHDLNLMLSSLGSDVSALADKHRTYPILHYYHSETRERASALGVAALDEALTLMELGVAGDERLYNKALLDSSRSSLTSYLSTLNEAFISPAEHAPPPPRLAPLRAAGIPTVDDEEFARAVDGLAERRRKLLGVVQGDAWQWPEDTR